MTKSVTFFNYLRKKKTFLMFRHENFKNISKASQKEKQGKQKIIEN
jgi:hypothetical protein